MNHTDASVEEFSQLQLCESVRAVLMHQDYEVTLPLLGCIPQMLLCVLFETPRTHFTIVVAIVPQLVYVSC